MTITKTSTLREVALTVGAALDRHGVKAVLSGGACASIHSASEGSGRGASKKTTSSNSRSSRVVYETGADTVEGLWGLTVLRTTESEAKRHNVGYQTLINRVLADYAAAT